MLNKVFLINNFVSITHYKIMFVFKSLVIEFASQLVPKKQNIALFLLSHEMSLKCNYFLLLIANICSFLIYKWFNIFYCRSLMGAHNAVLISGIHLNHQYEHFFYYYNYQNMSPSHDILRQSLGILVPKYPELRNNWVLQWFVFY